jgi:hypothetical protein
MHGRAVRVAVRPPVTSLHGVKAGGKGCLRLYTTSHDQTTGCPLQRVKNADTVRVRRGVLPGCTVGHMAVSGVVKRRPTESDGSIKPDPCPECGAVRIWSKDPYISGRSMYTKHREFCLIGRRVKWLKSETRRKAEWQAKLKRSETLLLQAMMEL